MAKTLSSCRLRHNSDKLSIAEAVKLVKSGVIGEVRDVDRAGRYTCQNGDSQIWIEPCDSSQHPNLIGRSRSTTAECQSNRWRLMWIVILASQICIRNIAVMNGTQVNTF